AVILLGVAADLGFRKIQLQRLASQLASMQSAAAESQKMVVSWNELRSAVDPGTFAIDQLDAVASQIPGEQVRLTQYNYDKGRLVITGEAADVSQAYEFFEKVKKVPMLQDYDWTSRQPQLAGRNKVRFEMEGVRPDAKTGEE
ncbi:MAG: PilN domain-containing protein, partial [Spartobacteria bacterium]